MKIVNTQIIDIPAETAWQIFGREFEDGYKWSSFISHSEAKHEGPTVGDAEITGRTCQTPLGQIDETLLVYNDDCKELKFAMKAERLPFFMNNLTSQWKMSDAGDGKTRAETEINVDLDFPFNILLGWLIQRNFKKTVNRLGPELAAYARQRSEMPLAA